MEPRVFIDLAPKVSVIIPCYNQAQYLPEALRSVSDQSYSNWECIIVNDGSPDDTETVALEWCEKDSRFHYLKKENGGLSSARNAALSIAKGEWIQFLDADDWIHPQKIESSIVLINSDPGIKLVVTDFKFFSTNIAEAHEPHFKIHKESLTFENILFKWSDNFTIPIHCALFNSKIIKRIQFDENFKAIEDWIMWVNYFIETQNTGFIDKPLAFYRNNPNGMTRDIILMNESLLKAYNHIIAIIPNTYTKKFAEVIFERLNNKLLKQLSAKQPELNPYLNKSTSKLNHSKQKKTIYNFKFSILKRIKLMFKKLILRIMYFIDGKLEIYRQLSFKRKQSELQKKFKFFGNDGKLPFPNRILNPKYISIGNNFFALNNLRIEAWDRFYNQRFNPKVSIGNNVIMNTDIHIACIDEIIIGNNVLMASRIYISDHSHGEISYDALKTIPSKRPLISKGPVTVEDNVWIGEGVCILPGVTIGKNSIIGANSVVTKSCLPNSVIAGVPAKVLRVL